MHRKIYCHTDQEMSDPLPQQPPLYCLPRNNVIETHTLTYLTPQLRGSLKMKNAEVLDGL